ncbi:MAG: glycosyltransferase family 2 protein [Elusimicrobiota bacterium]
MSLPLSVIIPAYNEVDRLPKLLARLRDWRPAEFSPLEILIVDDGSTDSTRALVKEFLPKDARVRLVEAKHGGAMHAIITGYREARYDYIANIDADSSTDPDEIARLARRLDTADVVTGSRLLRGDLPPIEGKSAFRRFISNGYSNLFGLLFRLGIRDPQIGCRIFRRRALLEILPALTSEHDGIKCSEILVKSYGLGHEIVEIPVAYRHDPDSRLVPRRPYAVIVRVFAALIVMWMDSDRQYRSGVLKRAPGRAGFLAAAVDKTWGPLIRRLCVAKEA